MNTTTTTTTHPRENQMSDAELEATYCQNCGEELSPEEYPPHCFSCQERLTGDFFDPQNDVGGIFFGMCDDEIPGPGEDY